MGTLRPRPKIKPVKLSPKEYHQLRLDVYDRCLAKCEICRMFMSFEEMSLHHKKTRGSGGGDTLDNVIGCHVLCHPD